MGSSKNNNYLKSLWSIGSGIFLFTDSKNIKKIIGMWYFPCPIFNQIRLKKKDFKIHKGNYL
jgi:hypothetical protein